MRGVDERPLHDRRRARRGQDGPAGHGDPPGDQVDGRALVEERGGGEVGHHEQRRQQQETPGRGSEGRAAGQRAGRRPAAGAAVRGFPLPAHPGVDEPGRGEDQDARPDVDVQQIEQRPVLGHQRQVAEPDDVQGGDGGQADRGAAQPRTPGGGKGEDRPGAQRHRVAAAAARVGVDEVRGRAGELVGHPLLELRERLQEGPLHPRQPHQAEQPDEPGAGHEREPEHAVRLRSGRRGAGRLPGGREPGPGRRGRCIRCVHQATPSPPDGSAARVPAASSAAGHTATVASRYPCRRSPSQRRDARSNGAHSAPVSRSSGRSHVWQARSSIRSQPGMNRIPVSAVTVKPWRRRGGAGQGAGAPAGVPTSTSSRSRPMVPVTWKNRSGIGRCTIARGTPCAGGFQGAEVDLHPADRGQRQVRREERELPPADDREHRPAARQPVADDAPQHPAVGVPLLDEDGVHVMQVGQRRRDVRAGQIRTHQHDGALREQPRHPREGIVPHGLADHGEARARDEPHEQRAGGQGQPRAAASPHSHRGHRSAGWRATIGAAADPRTRARHGGRSAGPSSDRRWASPAAISVRVRREEQRGAQQDPGRRHQRRLQPAAGRGLAPAEPCGRRPTGRTRLS